MQYSLFSWIDAPARYLVESITRRAQAQGRSRQGKWWASSSGSGGQEAMQAACSPPKRACPLAEQLLCSAQWRRDFPSSELQPDRYVCRHTPVSSCSSRRQSQFSKKSTKRLTYGSAASSCSFTKGLILSQEGFMVLDNTPRLHCIAMRTMFHVKGAFLLYANSLYFNQNLVVLSGYIDPSATKGCKLRFKLLCRLTISWTSA